VTQLSRLTPNGEAIRSIATGGFLLTERVHPPNGTLETHNHQEPIIGVVLSGSCVETVGKRVEECVPYSLQILPAGESHTYKFGREKVRCLSIQVNKEALEGIRRFSRILDRPVHTSGGLSSALTLRLYKEFRLMDNASLLSIEGLVLELLGDATQEQRRRLSSVVPLWLREAKEIIHENASSSISLTNVASRVDVHPSYLARMFRKHYGCCVSDYVRRLRLDQVFLELTQSDKSLAEIALATGFYDQSHLTNAFKLHFRMTPSELRATQRRVK
jgi:AraC family transcriptional regulator